MQSSSSIAYVRSVDATPASEIIVSLGQLAAIRRNELGLSCSSVAISVGVTEQMLAAFESGHIDPRAVRIEFILQLAKALNVSARDMFVALNKS